MAEELKDFKKERLEEREVSKFQDNVDEKMGQFDRIIKELISRIEKLENP